MKRCTHCGESKYIKNGSYKGVQRYKCKACERSFSDVIRKFNYKTKERALEMYLNNVGIRKIAKFIGCSPTLVLRWIKAFGKHKTQLEELEKERPATQISDTIEMDEIYTYVKKNEPEQWCGQLTAGTRGV